MQTCFNHPGAVYSVYDVQMGYAIENSDYDFDYTFTCFLLLSTLQLIYSWTFIKYQR